MGEVTNIIWGAVISLTAVTNWTGHIFQNKELGYVTTNHVCHILYSGGTNRFTLKVDASNIAVWRPEGVFSVTNNNFIILK